ncbi:hypothetical protein TNCV_3159071 [Trichonephila clavipes]|nr:hypothetical protein TNCV_3159071 [Trichonephila clavipes]
MRSDRRFSSPDPSPVAVASFLFPFDTFVRLGIAFVASPRHLLNSFPSFEDDGQDTRRRPINSPRYLSPLEFPGSILSPVFREKMGSFSRVRSFYPPPRLVPFVCLATRGHVRFHPLSVKKKLRMLRSKEQPAGWLGCFVAGLLHPRLRARPRSKSVDLLDAENLQWPCHM